MKTRRSFIKALGTGAALSTVAISSASFASAIIPGTEEKWKPIRIGIMVLKIRIPLVSGEYSISRKNSREGR